MGRLQGHSLSISTPRVSWHRRIDYRGIRLPPTGQTNSPPARVGVDLLWRPKVYPRQSGWCFPTCVHLKLFRFYNWLGWGTHLHTSQPCSPEWCWLRGFPSEQMRWGETRLQCGTKPEERAKAPQPFSSLTKTGTDDSQEHDSNFWNNHLKVHVAGRSHPRNQTT